MSDDDKAWGAHAEQAILYAMINLPAVSRKPLNAKTVIPYAVQVFLQASGSAFDTTRADEEVNGAVKRLVSKGDIAAPDYGAWRRLRL